MRTGKVWIGGKEYLTCFSTRVLMRVEEEKGEAAHQWLQKMVEKQSVGDMFWLLAQLIDAGNRYAKLEGLDNPGAISFDDLVDAVGVDEYGTMFAAVVETVNNGQTPTIKTKPEKNGKTTQEK